MVASLQEEVHRHEPGLFKLKHLGRASKIRRREANLQGQVRLDSRNGPCDQWNSLQGGGLSPQRINQWSSDSTANDWHLQVHHVAEPLPRLGVRRQPVRWNQANLIRLYHERWLDSVFQAQHLKQEGFARDYQVRALRNQNPRKQKSNEQSHGLDRWQQQSDFSSSRAVEYQDRKEPWQQGAQEELAVLVLWVRWLLILPTRR